MKVITSMLAIFGALLICAQQANAEEARVACKDDYGKITVHRGQCPYGKELVQVMDSQSTRHAKVACKDDYGKITVHRGQCPYGKEFVKVMD